ncbi:MAG: hypothetical protein IH935_02200 [Acidobacteria bacterium]|nr:hypothetical protein [Acidobacteriota bacterium]
MREGLSFNRSEATALLQAAVAETPGLEAMVLSTCNLTARPKHSVYGDEAASISGGCSHANVSSPQACVS